MSHELHSRLVLSQSDAFVVGMIRQLAISDVDVNSLTNMNTQDSTASINELQRILDISRSGQAAFPMASLEDLASFRRRAIRLLVKLSRHYNTFPAVLFVEGVSCNQKLDPIFRGGFADIFQGSIGDVMVALKRLRAYVSDGDRRRIQDILRKEAILWRQLDHPHVLPLLGIDATTFAPLYSIVTPWMENGNLFDFLEKNPSTPSQINRWVGEAAKGLQYLHEQGIVHGDLRAANVLVNYVHQACLADFGLACISSVASTAVNTTAPLTNARWLAPELLAGDESTATMEGDVFALGRVCLEAYTVRMPFWYIQRDAVVISKILAGENVRRPTAGETGFQGLSDHLWGILQRCWEKDPSERPSVTACIQLLEYGTEEPSLVHPLHESSWPLHSQQQHAEGEMTLANSADAGPFVNTGGPCLGPMSQNVAAHSTKDASEKRHKVETIQCPIDGCTSTFSRRFNLRSHMRSHNEERPFKCTWPGCQKSFARQHDCKAHEHLHLNVRPFKCEGCKKTFARADALNRHLRSEGGVDCRQLQVEILTNAAAYPGMSQYHPSLLPTHGISLVLHMADPDITMADPDITMADPDMAQWHDGGLLM